MVLDRLGELHAAMGDLQAARANWERALTIFDELGDSKAGEIRAELGRLTQKDVDAGVSGRTARS
jgi:hypothetical protein